MRISLIHSEQDRIDGLKENLDLIIEIDQQISLIRDLIRQFQFRGLTVRQKILLNSTLSEMRIRFRYLEKSIVEDLYNDNKIIELECRIKA